MGEAALIWQSKEVLSPETPPINVYESSGQLTIALPLPGAHHDTVEVRLEGQKLSVRAEARYPQEQQHYLHHEWKVGRSQRQIELPRPVTSRGAKAMLTHGILTISLPLDGGKGGADGRIPVSEVSQHQGV